MTAWGGWSSEKKKCGCSGSPTHIDHTHRRPAEIPVACRGPQMRLLRFIPAHAPAYVSLPVSPLMLCAPRSVGVRAPKTVGGTRSKESLVYGQPSVHVLLIMVTAIIMSLYFLQDRQAKSTKMLLKCEYLPVSLGAGATKGRKRI